MDHDVVRRAQWTSVSLKHAVNAVTSHGLSKRAAALRYGVPRGTLQRHIKRAMEGLGVERKLGRSCILTCEQEDLASRILDMEARLYGLSSEDIRRLVYKFCVKYKIKHNFNDEKCIVGRKWLKCFLRRHPELSIRMPEKTSLARATGFNKAKVDIYFNTLQNELFDEEGSRKIQPANIFNVDETGITICQKAQRIVGKKGKRNIGIVTSAEKGKNIAVVCCVSVSGLYVPPMFIYPRRRVGQEFLDRGPIGAVAEGSKTGWITDELFNKWFQHFRKIVQPQTRESPTLLLADGHVSHTNNLELVEMARKNNVIILIFPSHCTHRLQPLDVAIFKSLKSNYDKQVSKFKGWIIILKYFHRCCCFDKPNHSPPDARIRLALMFSNFHVRNWSMLH
jgi:hypothetical protein